MKEAAIGFVYLNLRGNKSEHIREKERNNEEIKGLEVVMATEQHTTKHPDIRKTESESEVFGKILVNYCFDWR